MRVPLSSFPTVNVEGLKIDVSESRRRQEEGKRGRWERGGGKGEGRDHGPGGYISPVTWSRPFAKRGTTSVIGLSMVRKEKRV
jgi:hypothetical protein